MSAHLDLPPLPYADWRETKDALHLFLQIVGKVRMAAHPKLNHWWHVTLYPTVDGLTTGRIPASQTSPGFEIALDLRLHKARVTRDDCRDVVFAFDDATVAQFHDRLFAALSELGVSVDIVGVPYDNKSKTPFAEDHAARPYDGAAVDRFRRALHAVANMFEQRRARFLGKQTPVHLYWHSFDLTTTRFSGRAHPMTGGRQSDREAYSHEVVSAGFWAGDDDFPHAAFYSYAYPEPTGLPDAPLTPDAAFWTEKNGSGLALLKYDDVRTADDPAATVDAFLESVYAPAARLGGWPVADLEHAAADEM